MHKGLFSRWRVGLPVAAAIATLACGQPAAAEPTTVSELIVTAAKTVAELTVTGKVKCLKPESSPAGAGRPRVVSSFPANGDVVRPGLLVIRVTFDQPMACQGIFTAAPPLQNPCPEDRQDMLLSLDRKTVRTVCLVEAGAKYAIWVTEDPTAGQGFVGLSGLPSEGRRLSFSTASEAPVSSVCVAMMEDAATARELRRRADVACPATSP